jgi:hypothetical protein
MTEDNAEILRSLYEVWGPHQVEAALRFFDPVVRCTAKSLGLAARHFAATRA